MSRTKHLLIRTQTELLRLKIEKIIYVSSDGNYSTFVMANGDKRTVTIQLGEIEQLMSEQLELKDNLFIRIGKSLIVNYSYIYHINITRQQLSLSDNHTFSYILSASRDALKKLKSMVEVNSLIKSIMKPIRKLFQDIPEINDDEIRVIGLSNQPGEDKELLSRVPRKIDDNQIDKRNYTRNYRGIIFIAVIALVFIGVLIGYYQPKAINTRSAIALSSNKDDRFLFPYSEVEYVDTKEMRLMVVTPLNCKPSLFVGHSCLDDTAAVCIAQAASIAIDKEGRSSIVGAMVVDGVPLSWGESKAGYCAILNDSIYIGASKHSSLFEEATEKEGDFFRQYSLVEDGKLSSMKNTDKHIRRALCVRNDVVQVISSVDPVVLNDFTRALIESGVTEALMLEGGDVILKYTDVKSNTTSIGIVDYPESDCVSYLVWK